MSEFIRPLTPDDDPGPPDSQLDDEPTPSAGLPIVLEPAPDATIGELVRSLATAILSAMSGRTRASAQRQPPEDPRMHPPGSRS